MNDQPANLCQHCQLPIPNGVVVADEAAAKFCCISCKAVYALLARQGLLDLYRQPQTANAEIQPPPSLQGREAQLHALLATNAKADQPCRLTVLPNYLSFAAEPAKSSLYQRAITPATNILPSDGERREPGMPEQVESLIDIGGMTCAACGWLNEHYLLNLGGVDAAHVNMATRRLLIRFRPAQVSLGQILTAIHALGYQPLPLNQALSLLQSAQSLAEQKAASRTLIWKLFIAGFATMQAMSFAVPLYFANVDALGNVMSDISAEELGVLRWTTMIIALPAILFAGWDYFARSWRDWRFRQVSMDVPIALGLSLGMAHSAWVTVQGGSGGNIYFDSMTMLLFFLLCGRYAEMRAHQKITQAFIRQDQAHTTTSLKRVQQAGGDTWVSCEASALKTDDVILIKHGAAIPVDGVLLATTTQTQVSIDESMLTGEAAAITKLADEPIHAGTINVGAAFVMKVLAAGRGRLRQEIEWMVAKALAVKPRFIGLALMVARYFVLLLLLVVLFTLILWVRLAGWDQAIKVVVALLVVTCPCALALSAPLTLSALMANLLQRGVLIQNVAVLEKIHRLKHILVDKTGTLTEGKVHIQQCSVYAQVAEVRWQAHDAKAIAALLESTSEHPLARAFVQHAAPATNLHLVGNIERLAQAGLMAVLSDAHGQHARWHIGTRAFCAISDEEAQQLAAPINDAAASPSANASAQTLVYLASMDGTRRCACFVLQDQLRPLAKKTLTQWQASGFTVSLLSGDRAESVWAMADAVAIPRQQSFYAQTPEQKAAFVRAQQARGEVVLMLGDGVNDAPVLALADISIGMPNASDLSKRSADILLLPGVEPWQRVQDLLPRLQQARRILMGNYLWAALYNAVVMPIAILGWVNPWVAGLGMTLSSLLVMGNSLRLLK